MITEILLDLEQGFERSSSKRMKPLYSKIKVT
jgi:hypothetical protein